MDAPSDVTTQPHYEPGRLRFEMAEIARQLQKKRGSIESILQAITETAVETVAGADHASIAS